ncbi:hypothetical protein F511_14871 [Dorcoceras hygrometricum]|uniref:Uncharacterized protein n=1 Tax=Dorcoceras hygrometricum TaxID=472368 RepID=A0A2Z7AI88_9LAMI|nr:hypothetical protein F511_14871 [Dorcoceras hygrometricum]
MLPKRTRAQGTGETSNTESTAQGSENPTLTTAQIAELVATTMAQILANQPESRQQPDQQSEEIRKLQEEIENMKRERSSAPPPPPDREVPFSSEVLAAELPQHFKFPNVGKYDGMGDPKEHYPGLRTLHSSISMLILVSAPFASRTRRKPPPRTDSSFRSLINTA